MCVCGKMYVSDDNAITFITFRWVNVIVAKDRDLFRYYCIVYDVLSFKLVPGYLDL